MAKELRRITFDELAANLDGDFERVTVNGETVVVETTDGARAILKPLLSKRSARKHRVITEADYQAFRASAGGWKDVDTDKLKRDIAESRSISTRPPR